MLKKKIIFGSVVLLLAALFALTGCSQATNSDGGSTVYKENHLFGRANWEDVARAVASAKASGRDVVLTDQTVIVGDGLFPTVADFEDLTVHVEGSVIIGSGGPVIVNAAKARLDFTEGSRITLMNNGVFIYQVKRTKFIPTTITPAIRSSTLATLLRPPRVPMPASP
jgi:hypothetical protein